MKNFFFFLFFSNQLSFASGLVCNGEYNGKAIKLEEKENNFSLIGFKSVLDSFKEMESLSLFAFDDSTDPEKGERTISLTSKVDKYEDTFNAFVFLDVKTRKATFDIEEYAGESEMPSRDITIQLKCN